MRGEIDAIRRHYDAEVAFVDEQLGRLLDALPEDAIVILTSDHGDEFLEHGGLLHGRTLYREVLRVPLVVRAPDAPGGRRVRSLVSHIDIAPTVLDLAGLPPLPDADGRSLRPLWSAPADAASPADERIVFSTLWSGELAHATARLGRWKLYRTRDRSLLFDLRRDPRERRDVAERHPRIAARLAEALDARSRSAAVPSDATSPERERERERALRNLGYIE